jgi:glutamate N-acetyltransferase/amino-acid N-acetyltransferase
MATEIKVIEGESITVIDGLKCFGIKDGRNGLGIVKCKGKVAGVFTQNKIKAPPLLITASNISGGEIEGIIVNSGNANAFTGSEGLKNAVRMAELLASKLKCEVEKIAVASTGVIGVQLDMDWIEDKVDEVFSNLNSDRSSATCFARSIMTTDSYPKEYVVRAGDVLIAGVAKGSGMISPMLSTMLVFIFTDADFGPAELKAMLVKAVDKSFNVLVVDGDTSTNDMVLLVATGKRKVDRDVFQRGLDKLCLELAKLIAKDGEGATKLIEVHVKGAKDEKDAFKAARAVVSSLLVKTAVFGSDPNWGRIIAALGYSNAEVNENITLVLECSSKSVILVDKGIVMDTREEAREIMKGCDEVKFIVDLHEGDHEGYAIGCDLSYEYVRINAEYTT